jgi:hypothetical protein
MDFLQQGTGDILIVYILFVLEHTAIDPLFCKHFCITFVPSGVKQ